MATTGNGASSDQSSPAADTSSDAVSTPQAAASRMEGALKEKLKRHKVTDDVIKLLEDYGVCSTESFVLLGEEDFAELKTRGLRPFQKSQLLVIGEQLQEGKGGGRQMTMETSGNSSRNVQVGTVHTMNVSNSASRSNKATQTQPFEVTGERYAHRAFLMRLQERLGKQMRKSMIQKLCKTYIENVDDENLSSKLQLGTTVTLFQVMEKRQDLKGDDVVLLQVLLWKAGFKDLFQYVANESKKWKELSDETIRHLSKASVESEPTRVKFHLHLDISKFGPDEQKDMKKRIAALLQANTDHLVILELEPDQSFWVIMEAPAVLCEAMYQIFHYRVTQKALEAMSIDKVTFYSITDSRKEETRYVGKTAPRPSTSSASLEHGSADTATDMEGKMADLSPGESTGSDVESGHAGTSCPVEREQSRGVAMTTKATDPLPTQKLAVAEDLEWFDAVFGDKGRIYVFPGTMKPWVRRLQAKRKSQHDSEQLSPQSDCSATSYESERSMEQSTTSETHTEHAMEDQTKAAIPKIKSPDLYLHDVFFTKKIKTEEKLITEQVYKEETNIHDTERIKAERTEIDHPDVYLEYVPCTKKSETEREITKKSYTGQVQQGKAEVVVIQKTKLALEEIKSPDDPPVFLLHNQHLCRSRDTAIHVLVLHPTLGVLVLEVMATTSSESSPHFKRAITQLLQAQEDIQEEMGDLLEKNAVVMTIALPNLQPEDAYVIRKITETEHLQDYPEIRLVCSSRTKVFTEWLQELVQLRASSHHAFKGSSDGERLDNYMRACMRRCSIAGLRPGESVNARADLHHHILLTPEQLRLRDSQAKLLHISGPIGSGKTTLLADRARRALREGCCLALVVDSYNVLLHHLTESVCGEKMDVARVSTHSSYSDLLDWLDDNSTKGPIFIAIDEARFSCKSDFYSSLLNLVRADRVQGLWTADTTPSVDRTESELQSLGVSTVHLSWCLRCPPHVMAWANILKEKWDPKLEPPSVPVTQDLGVGVKIIYHPDHSHSKCWRTCPRCREEVTAFFSSLGLYGQRVTSSLSLSDVVVLTTGASCDREEVAVWLCRLGLHAVAETERYDTPILPPGVAPISTATTDAEGIRQRILKGKDITGNPAVQVLDPDDFQGLERKVVLLWHEDEDDEDRDRQTEIDREDRKSWHRSMWYRAASHCQGHLVALVTTPSPAWPLLQANNPPPCTASLPPLPSLQQQSNPRPSSPPE